MAEQKVPATNSLQMRGDLGDTKKEVQSSSIRNHRRSGNEIKYLWVYLNRKWSFKHKVKDVASKASVKLLQAHVTVVTYA